MKISFIKSLWGFEGEEPQAFVKRLRDAGYDGVEAPIFVDTLPYRDAGLDYVAQAFCETADSLARAVDASASQGALLLNVQAGKDYWDDEIADRFLDDVRLVVSDSPVPVVFETHRGRLFYSPASTLRILNRHPWIRLCADFSHWTCVSESFLADQESAVDRAIAHTDYIHARLGFTQGPQVSSIDTESQEFEAFWGWWYRILESNQQATFRIDPEFGPPPYMVVPADLWSICRDMMMAIRERL